MSTTNDRELLSFAAEIARYPRPTAPNALRVHLRAELLAARLGPVRSSPLAWMRFSALRPALAAVVVLALLSAAGGSAAAGSLPGDPAFSLKRAAEQVEVAVALDDATRLGVLVTQSDRRLADLDTATARKQSAIVPATDEYLAAVGRVEATLTTVLTERATPARDAAIARASSASAEHIAMLEQLAGRLPAAAQHGIQRAIEAQQTVHGKSGNAPGRTTPGVPGAPGTSGAPGRPSNLPGGPPSNLPGGPPPGRGGPPSGVPGRP